MIRYQDENYCRHCGRRVPDNAPLVIINSQYCNTQFCSEDCYHLYDRNDDCDDEYQKGEENEEELYKDEE